MFPDLPRPDVGADAIDQLAKVLIDRADDSGLNEGIPAGYTYIGQFIDHDITFDPASKLERKNDPDALVDFRTPRFDLDSLYGDGPDDQPFLYEWENVEDRGVKLLVDLGDPSSDLADEDLPRNRQGRALIGDRRNDEHLIISQLHLLFIKFHNKVVDRVREQQGLDHEALLEESQRIVRWHYQWIVMHDYLTRVVGPHPPAVDGRFFSGRDPFIPVEFSAAAFRFGHSMVRASYELNGTVGKGIPIFGDKTDPLGLGGFRPLPRRLKISWRRFFKVPGPPPDPAHPESLRASMLIDTVLVPALRHVPPDDIALMERNLKRGRALGLPCGQDVARAMRLDPLEGGDLGLDDARLDAAAREAILAATPLWYYILREAEMAPGKGQWLGPVGGRIVAEVLRGLLEGDPQSYVHVWPTWKPELPCTGGDFTMGDLVHFTMPEV
jgi:hypothetical protein